LYYRVRWALTEKPWRLKLGADLNVLAPKGGAGALIYYLGYSEPETAAFVTGFLKPGMVFWDIGAHIGEYSLLAARTVGPAGRVEALEPQPAIRDYLAANIELNHFSNIRVHRFAAAEHIGEATLALCGEPSTAHLTNTPHVSECVRVPTISLDAFLAFTGTVPNLVKVDVEGAEKQVLHGAQSLLSMPAQSAPVWIMEYSPENCSSNGYAAESLVDKFSAAGYRTYGLQADGRVTPWPASPRLRGTLNFVASKGDLIA
jgi:FkbM family methyltransferase